jgi:hypothetical protein
VGKGVAENLIPEAQSSNCIFMQMAKVLMGTAGAGTDSVLDITAT